MSKKETLVRRSATALAAIGMLVMSSGIALMVGVGPANAATKVSICHATNSDTNPYVYIEVDDDSSKLTAHLEHRNDPNKIWKTDGVFNGTPHSAGDPKPDLIGDYVDENDVPHVYDGVINGESCENTVTEIETTASVAFTDPNCDNDNTASFETSGEHVAFSTVTPAEPGATVSVTATVEDGYTFADDVQQLVFEHTFAEAEADCTEVTGPEDPEDPTPPQNEVSTPTPTVVHAGLVGSVQESGSSNQGLALLLAGLAVMGAAAGLGMVRPHGGTS